MKPMNEEIEIFKGIRFSPGRYRPSKEFYIEILFDIRKEREK